MRKRTMLALALLGLAVQSRAEASLQEQLDALKADINYIKTNYERTEPGESIKAVTEYVSPTGEIFREPQPGGVSPSDGSKLEERVTYRKLKFARRESVGDKIGEAVNSAINGHVIVGLEFTGTYLNTVGAGDYVDALGVTRSANRGRAEGALDINFSGKPMRNTVLFADLDAASGTPALSEAWVLVSGPKSVFSLQAGVIDLTGSFDANLVANDETTQFMSPEFVNSPLLKNPANGVGAVVRTQYGRYEALVGAQNTLTTLNDVTDDLYLVAELGFRYHMMGDAHWRMWGRQQPRGANQPDQALGLSVDHRVSTRLSTFWRYAKNSYVEAFDEAADLRWAVNTHDWAASGGFELTNFNPRNLKEKLGVAYGRTVLQDQSYGDVAEAYWRLPLTPNFAASLHYQAGFSNIPAGLGLDGNPPTHTVGLRVQANY
jgi:hypothetical protein